MKYELLVSAKDGKVVDAKPSGFMWKKGEKDTSVFTIVEHESDLSQQELIETYHMKDSKIEIDNSIITKKDAPTFQPIIEEEAAAKDPNWKDKVSSVCEFFEPKYLPSNRDDDYKLMREYWYKKFSKFKHLDLKKFLAAIMYRDYGNIARALKTLPSEYKEEIMKSDVFTDEDKSWMKWLSGEDGDNSNK